MINGEEEENALLMVNGLLLARSHGAVMNQSEWRHCENFRGGNMGKTQQEIASHFEH
jgi:hypothetical protein